MNINSIVIDSRKTIGGKTILTKVSPVYVYNNGQRTNEIEGYRYEVVLPSRSYEKLTVKIPGEKRLEMPEDCEEVQFDNLELFVYWRAGTYDVAAQATDVRFAKAAAKG